MTPATTGYAKVAIGQDTPWGIATPLCAGSMNGRWACALHGIESFADVAEMVWHIDDSGPDCLIAWRCRRCGETHGLAR